MNNKNKYQLFLNLFENNTKNLSYEKIIKMEKQINLINIKDIKDFYLGKFSLENWKKFEKNIENIIDLSIKDINLKSFNSGFALKISKSNYFTKFIDGENKNINLVSLDLLKNSIENVFATDYYETFFDKLSVIWFRIIKNHPFNNGNKRISILSTKIFLIQTIVLSFVSAVYINIDIKYNILKKQLNQYIRKNNIFLNKIDQNKIKKDFLNQYDLELEKFIKDSKIKIEKILFNYYEDNLSSDYILSIFIANQETFKFKSDELEQIYLILKFNLIYFLIKYDWFSIVEVLNKNLENKIDQIFDKFSIDDYFSNL